MSIFGKLDAAVISTNPFKIDEGEYEAEITSAEFTTNREDRRQLVIEYTITSEESSFKGNKAKEFFPMVSEDMTLEMLAMLPPSEQADVRKNNANLKKRLCGYNERNKGLGVDENDLNDPDWTPEVLKGIQVMLGITNGSNGQYTNVKWVTLAE